MKALILTLSLVAATSAFAAIETTVTEIETPHKTINTHVIETKNIADIIKSLNDGTELVQEENALKWSATLEEGAINDTARNSSIE
jgi:hypothetical protein